MSKICENQYFQNLMQGRIELFFQLQTYIVKNYNKAIFILKIGKILKKLQNPTPD